MSFDRTAGQNKSNFADLSNSIRRSISLVSRLSSLLESGGFHQTKFLFNNVAVLSSVPQNELAREVDLASCIFPAQKALGVSWNPQTARLMVKICIKQRSCTRRGIMSMIAQTYDPLGLIQPFLLPAKQILKDMYKRSLHWDDNLGDYLQLGER